MALNLPTFGASLPNAISRNAEYTDAPFTDIVGDGSYNSYLGMNRAGSNADVIGVNTGAVYLTAAEIAAAAPDDARPDNWTELDQDEAARIPQVTQLLGGSGFVDRTVATGNWNGSGGVEGKGDLPAQFIEQPASVPGTVVTDSTANLVIATVAAADGAVYDVAAGVVNKTGETLTIGDLVWGPVPAP
jgi:hypothetical protein